MIQFSGEILIVLAILAAFAQAISPLVGHFRSNSLLLSYARPFAIAQFIFVTLAYLLLTLAFAINDFSIAYVAGNSHPTLPLFYRLAAVWGAHEGSILLWIVILAGWTMVVSVLQKTNSCTDALAQGVLGIISLSLLLFLLLTSNPFLSTSAQSTGQDLNPLLQDPGFMVHPPMLYVGYVGFSVVFALTQAALLSQKLDREWARSTKRFALAAWCFLTLGITLGSWWAYRVLGWGGFWFWDPVENASLLPWLTGTALIHVLVLAEKRELAKNWAVLLTIICFALSLFGTFLVRSGLLISAHSFANDPARGLALLILFVILMTAALSVYTVKMPTISKRSIAFTLLSREMGLTLNSILLMIAMLTILLGTLYPMILEALHLGEISVGAPYFNSSIQPLVFVSMMAMAIAGFSRWQDQSLQDLWQKTWPKFLISLSIAAFITYAISDRLEPIALLNITLSIFIVFSIVPSMRTLQSMALAHSGFAILIMGIMLSSVLNAEQEVRMKPGNSVALGPYQFLFVKTNSETASNYRSIRAQFEVTKNNHHVSYMYPEKRLYTVRRMVTSNVAIDTSIFRDLYLALGEPLDLENSWSVRLHYKPFIRWIWLGGIVMVLGGLLSLFNYNRFKTV